ncbi:hypothetical protein SEA_SCHOOLBUS_116 [Mycobacterium phage SchoolBus]|nr:hypothetical protein SEA_FAMILTON_117 [Mycobacterium phage Familton]AVI04144.1 hypothetical protein SEA_JANGDYNASTY_113 [Mycobacterium phage JangDynasty]AVP42771.1 hypothetical protein SEA_SCHOOLBUS_116 [Mycobacterium phage SchoolBus]URM87890.1 hypothetical protein SEA_IDERGOLLASPER_119 [Mycobacterium phage Idergollasper]
MAAIRVGGQRIEVPDGCRVRGRCASSAPATDAYRTRVRAGFYAGGSGLFGNRTLHEKEDDR